MKKLLVFFAGLIAIGAIYILEEKYRDAQVEKSLKLAGSYQWPVGAAGMDPRSNISKLMLGFYDQTSDLCPLQDLLGIRKDEGGGWKARPGLGRYSAANVSGPRYPAFAGINQVYVYIGPLYEYVYRPQKNKSRFRVALKEEWISSGYPVEDFEYLGSQDFHDYILNLPRISNIKNCLMRHGAPTSEGFKIIDSPTHKNLHDLDALTIIVHPIFDNHRPKRFEIVPIYYRSIFRVVNKWSIFGRFESVVKQSVPEKSLFNGDSIYGNTETGLRTFGMRIKEKHLAYLQSIDFVEKYPEAVCMSITECYSK